MGGARFRSRATPRFWRAYGALPPHVRRLARIAFRTFRLDPAYPALHFKCVHPSRPIYSARVGLGYRAVGVMDGDTIIWFWIGSHGDYDRLIGEL